MSGGGGCARLALHRLQKGEGARAIGEKGVKR